MKIAIVNDMPIAVEVLRRVLLTVPEYQVAWIATSGVEVLAKCAKDTPGLILMDLIMRGMNGVEATRQIMKQSPCAIVIVTANVGQNTAKVFEAMSYGALDAVNTPILGSQGKPKASQAALLRKIATIAKLVGKPPQTNLTSSPNCDRLVYRRTQSSSHYSLALASRLGSSDRNCSTR